MTLACILLALAAFYAAATPYMPAKAWRIIDLPSHFAIQGAVASAVLVFAFNALLVTALDMALLAAIFSLALALVLQLKTLKPFLPARQQPKSGEKIKILQNNLLKTKTDAAPLLALVEKENPDIIACCEVSPAMAQNLTSLKKAYPHHLLAGDPSGYGVAIFSKMPFDSIDTLKPAGARATSIVFKIKNITFLALHTVTPVADITARDAELSAHAGTFKGVAPLVVAGDFNATPWCPAMKSFCDALKLRNARQGLGLAPSWPVWLPFFMRLPIDHVLVSEGISVDSFRTGSPTGSDHLPTITVITP